MKGFKFIFGIMLLHKAAFLAAVKLKLRIKHEALSRTRKFKVDLETNFIRDGVALSHYQRNVKIGKNFQIRFEGKDDQDKYKFCFHVYTNPIGNEFVPDQTDQDPMDDRPYREERNNIEMDDIRQMFKSVEVTLLAPLLSKRYVINLESMEPKNIWWNRRILTNSDNDLSNYHAFLYAIITKSIRDDENSESEKKFLGDAPLKKVIGQIESNSQQNEFAEYFLSIPVDLTRFFKHKIWYNELHIYRYEESKFSSDLKMKTTKEKPKKETEVNGCSICLDPIIDEQLIIKLHGEKDNKAEHIFHEICIKKWFKVNQKFRCPLCNRELKIELRALLPSLFSGNANSYSKMFMNPIGELARIANGMTEEKHLKQKQAENELKQILGILNTEEKILRNLLDEIHFPNLVGNWEEKLVELKDGKLIANPLLENIRKEVEQFVTNYINPWEEEEDNEVIEIAEKALSSVQALINGQLIGHIAVQNMATITVDKKEEKKPAVKWLISRFKKMKNRGKKLIEKN